MRNLIKVVSIWCILCLLPIPFASAVQDGAESVGRVRERAEYLAALKLIDRGQTEDYTSDSSVTKAELALLLIRAMGYAELAETTAADGELAELPKDGSGGAVRLCQQLGIINGDETGRVFPDKKLTGNEAVKMIVEAVGYGPVARNSGGYPAGYLTQANRLKLLRGSNISWNEEITKAEITTILYYALDVEVLRITGVSDVTWYETVAGDTLEKHYLDTKKWMLAEGIVEANADASLLGGARLEHGKVIVSGTSYKSGDSGVDEFLGYRVKLVIDEDGVTIIGYSRSEDNQIISLKARDITEFLSGKLTYQTAEGDEEELELANNVAVMLNHRLLNPYKPDELKLSHGNVTLIDNDGDDVFDCVMMTQPQSFLVKEVSEANDIIYIQDAYFNGRDAINVTSDDDRVVVFREQSGEEIAFSDLKQGDAISVLASGDENYIEIIRLGAPVTGRITELLREESKVKIDDETYYFTDQLNFFTLGLEASFYLDVNGEVFWAEQSDEEYAYLADKNQDTSGIGGTVQVKLFSLRDGMRTLDVADNIRIDRVAYKSADKAYGAIKADTLVTYRINADGALSRLEYISPHGERAERTYQKAANGFNSDSSSTAEAYKLDENTKIFCVPKNGVSEEFGAAIELKDGDKLSTQGFDYNVDKKTIGALVVEVDTEGSSTNLTELSPIAIVNKVSTVMNDNDEATYRIDGFTDGKPFNWDVRDSGSNFREASKLRTGDVFRYIKNYKNEIILLERIIDLSKDREPFVEGQNSASEQILGYPLRMERGIMTNYSKYLQHKLYVSTTRNFDDSVEFRFFADEENPYATDSVYREYYLFDRGKQTVSKATAADIITTENSGDPSKIFVQSTQGKVQFLVIIKD